MSTRALHRGVWVVAIGVSVLLAAANLYFGDLNQDEGWYLYAAGLVARGEFPYIDFAFTQGPVMPLVYALIHPLVTLGGLAGGRLFTALLGLGAAILAACLAARLGGKTQARTAALLTFLLVGVNVYQSYFCTVVKTYALTAFFLAAGFLLLTVGQGKRGRWTAAAAAGLLVLAAGTRISAVVTLPAVLIWLWWQRPARPGQWLWFGIAAAGFAAALFLPFYLNARDSFLFGLLQYHTARSAGNAVTWLVYRAGFISRVTQAYFPAFALLALVLTTRWLRRDVPAGSAGRTDAPAPYPGLTALLWGCVAAITLIHCGTAVPYDDYQVMIYPVFAAALALAAVRQFPDEHQGRVLLVTMILTAVASSFSSSINQDWFNRGRDRIWWRLKEKPALRLLQETAAAVRTQAGGAGGELLTQDTYLAVEAGLRVPRGLELGPFSYYPDWTEAEARKYHVLNRSLMESLLETSRAPIAAFSGYGLAIASPQVAELPREEQARLRSILATHYREVARVPAFGQGFTELVVFQRE